MNELNQKSSSPSGSTSTEDLDSWVLFSLFLHSGLTVVGLIRRRMKRSRLLAPFTAILYLYAIGSANYAMGVVPDNSAKGGRTGDLKVFWAPFFILHLGGPSTITVLSVSDNELWLRYATHLFTLSYTFGRIFFHNYFLENYLWVASFLVFLAGAIKYTERVCCLFGARLTKFRGSTFPRPGPGVNYARLMLAYSSLRTSNVPAEFRVTLNSAGTFDGPVCATVSKLTQLQIIQEAVRLFGDFQGLFVNRPYSYSKREQTRKMFLNLDGEQALAICEAELKLAYDVFFTKFLLLLRNSTIRVVLLNLFVFALQLLSLVIWVRVDKTQFQPSSVKVTHVLVYGTIAVDLISLHTLLTSDWVVARAHIAFLQKLLFFLDPLRILPCTKQSVLIQQLNLFTAEPVNSTPRNLHELFRSSKIPVVNLPDELPKFLFHELQTRSNLAQQPRDVEEICKSRGVWALTLLSGKYGAGSNGIDLARAFAPWISGVDYEESLVLWHVATTLCSEPGSRDHDLSNIMSNYMFNLLIRDTKLMPPSAKFLGAIIFRDTKAEAKRHLVRIPPPRSRSDEDWVRAACKSIMGVNTELIRPEEVLGEDSRSVLFEASVLAKKLQSLEEMGINKWEVMNKVWAEMLFYAAAQCPSSVYVEKLAQGSQLLTTVWLLMAHLGLGKHFRHNKAKEMRAHLLVTKLA